METRASLGLRSQSILHTTATHTTLGGTTRAIRAVVPPRTANPLSRWSPTLSFLPQHTPTSDFSSSKRWLVGGGIGLSGLVLLGNVRRLCVCAHWRNIPEHHPRPSRAPERRSSMFHPGRTSALASVSGVSLTFTSQSEVCASERRTTIQMDGGARRTPHTNPA